jgi:hypothetical protein
MLFVLLQISEVCFPCPPNNFSLCFPYWVIILLFQFSDSFLGLLHASFEPIFNEMNVCVLLPLLQSHVFNTNSKQEPLGDDQVMRALIS